VEKDDSRTDAQDLAKVSARIDQVQYTSNQGSWIDRPLDWSVHPKYSAVMLHGKFVSPQAFANAVSPGQWGYFYESTWLDLCLTPDYHFGEVSAHDEGKRVVTLDVWRTNKDYHYPESVEKQVAVTYGDDTVFRIEGEASTADQVLNRAGGTLQVHPPREQVILLETTASRFDPGQMVLDARRGQANGRCRNAVFLRHEPGKYVFRTAEGKEIVLEKLPFPVLDGKLNADNAVALKPGRHVALAYYRSEKAPHYMFLRTMDDEIRGVVKRVAGSTVTVRATAWDGLESDVTVRIDPAGTMYLDGVKGQEPEAIKVGQGIRVFPKRAQTTVALKRRALVTTKDKGNADGYLPVASFRCPQRVIGKQTLTFDARSSYAFNGEIKSYTWDFGDGTTAIGKVVQHTFAAEAHGGFEVKLTVVDASGHRHSTFRHVAVAPGLMTPSRSDSQGLTLGLKLQSWTKIDKLLQKKIHADGAPVTMEGEPQDTVIIPSFDYVAAKLGRREAAVWRTSGYVKAPRDGWYVIASISKTRLWINDVPILKGATGSNELGQRSFVFLAKGLHKVRYDYAGQLTYNRFTWMYLNGERVVPNKAPDTSLTLSKWHRIGPFVPGDFDEAHSTSFVDESVVDLKKTYDKLKWVEAGDLVDDKVHELGRDHYSAHYLFRTIRSGSTRQLTLSLGSNDSFRFWFNGRLVIDKKTKRPAAPGQDKITLNLEAGENTLLLKVANHTKDCQFYFNPERADITEDAMWRTYRPFGLLTFHQTESKGGQR